MDGTLNTEGIDAVIKRIWIRQGSNGFSTDEENDILDLAREMLHICAYLSKMNAKYPIDEDIKKPKEKDEFEWKPCC